MLLRSPCHPRLSTVPHTEQRLQLGGNDAGCTGDLVTCSPAAHLLALRGYLVALQGQRTLDLVSGADVVAACRVDLPLHPEWSLEQV